ncbi:MAG: Gfo/Idh/MocA family oxidoreductase [Clostridiales bacterium]|nr:Gfo/Idh/MocA family oxidoreductase [Clostridiales bacterium]
MKKIRFIIIGSGWRSLFYVRITRALPEMFELCAMYCRTEEKAEKIAGEQGIYTTTSVEECLSFGADFAVVAVNKADIFKVSRQWLERGLAVLCETPVGLNMDDLREAYKLRQSGAKLMCAEQYIYFPYFSSVIKLAERGLLGEPYSVGISAVHDYHAASIIRRILNKHTESFKVYGKTYKFSVTETADRYNKFFDGRQAVKDRVRLTFEYEDGKAAFYDFCSVQYRSDIRSNYICIQGPQGEIFNNSVSYIDENFIPRKKTLVFEGNNDKICFGDEILYKNPFGTRLNDDERAIAEVMVKTAEYVRGGTDGGNLECALTDAYYSIKMKEALETGKEISGSPKLLFTEG